jgi:hypothetical protein|tara:strand:- start:355 stop:624 length:270 start_codon:yes stop_codon:yes gene_type:complete
MTERYAGPPRAPMWQRLEQHEKVRGDGDIVHIGGEVQGFTENSLTTSEKKKLNNKYEKQSMYYETLRQRGYTSSKVIKLNKSKKINKLL